MIDEELPDALDGERLDRVVAMLDGCSRSVAATLIAEGNVSIDGLVVTQRSTRVAVGNRISFAPTVEEVVTVDPDSEVEFETVYSDEQVIVINKPSGLVVHPGAGRPDKTLVNGLLAAFPEIATVGEPLRPGIVHRLDGETSGLLVVARTAAAYTHLVSAMARHDVIRQYVAVVSGSVVDERGLIDAPIGRSTHRRTRMAVLSDGREARTHYEVRERRQDDPATTLLQCRLETGRTHQIRVHLSAIGYPVLGDQTYGTAVSKRAFDRVALHAERLGFEHPSTGEQLSFDAEMPTDLTDLVTELFG